MHEQTTYRQLQPEERNTPPAAAKLNVQGIAWSVVLMLFDWRSSPQQIVGTLKLVAAAAVRKNLAIRYYPSGHMIDLDRVRARRSRLICRISTDSAATDRGAMAHILARHTVAAAR